VHDTIWFGTNMGRVYRSTDRGLNYTVATVQPFNGKYIEPSFRNGMHGLVQDKSAGSTGAMCETFDGGLTWAAVATTGPVFATDLVYVPGTSNTWVSSGSTGNMGSSYSFDGGHTWAAFLGTDGARYMQMSWVNNHCGWAGGVNVNATENGAYKFIGLLRPPLPAPTNLQANVVNHDVHLTWNAPSVNPIGYNMYRNGLKLNAAVIAGTVYDDQTVVSGVYTYCVKAVYQDGESDGSCAIVDVAVGAGELAKTGFSVYPNPATSRLTVSPGFTGEYQVLDFSGSVVMTGVIEQQNQEISITGLPAGIYVLRMTASGISVKFVKAG
jgi:hypothetical protein